MVLDQITHFLQQLNNIEGMTQGYLVPPPKKKS